MGSPVLSTNPQPHKPQVQRWVLLRRCLLVGWASYTEELFHLSELCLAPSQEKVYCLQPGYVNHKSGRLNLNCQSSRLRHSWWRKRGWDADKLKGYSRRLGSDSEVALADEPLRVGYSLYHPPKLEEIFKPTMCVLQHRIMRHKGAT